MKVALMKRWATLCALALTASLAACTADGSEDEDRPDSRLSAENACGGLSADAASALEGIAEAREFKYRFDDSVAGALRDNLLDASRRGSRYVACEITPERPEKAEGVGRISVSFEELSELPPSEGDNVGLLSLPIGLRAVGDDGSAEIFFECNIAGKGKSIVHGKLIYRAALREVDPREGNIRVLQDISRKMATDLHCPSSGGIPQV